MTVTKFRTTSVCVVVLDCGHIGYCENAFISIKILYSTPEHRAD